MPSFDPAETALVLIDLQNGIVGRPLAPRDGGAVVAAGKALADRFRVAGAPVVLVRVAWSADFADLPPQAVDQPMTHAAGGLPLGWADYVDGLVQPGDLAVTKRQWGAFHGTELDLQLRRRGVKRIVVGGIATNFGVESTVRQAWEYGYEVVVAEDACATASAQLHALAVEAIFPRIARVLRCADIALAAG